MDKCITSCQHSIGFVSLQQSQFGHLYSMSLIGLKRCLKIASVPFSKLLSAITQLLVPTMAYFSSKFLAFLVFIFMRCINSSTLNYTLSLNTSNILRTVNEPFYGFTIDFWNNEDSYGKWSPDAGILTLNLSNPNLIALTKELAPAKLRIGGSPEDSVVYDINGECSQQYGLPQYGCSQTTNTNYYGCINKTRWIEINNFGLETGVDVIFGLNACYGRPSPDQPMNFSNIISLLNFTQTFAQNSFFGFELGNELAAGLNGHVELQRVNASRYAADFYTSYRILDGQYKLLGNDDANTGYSDHFMGNLSEIIAPDSLNVSDVLYALTYHHYPQCSYPNGTLVFDPNFTCEPTQSIIAYSTAFKAVSSKYGVPAIMGEGKKCVLMRVMRFSAVDINRC